MSRIPCDLHEVGGSHGLCRCDTRRQVVQPLGAWRMALPRRPRGTSCHTCRSRWRPRRRQTAEKQFEQCCSWQAAPYQVEVSRWVLPTRMIATRVSRLALLRLGRAPFHPCNERAADKSTRIGVRNRSATCVNAEAKAPLPCPSSSLLKAGPSMALPRVRKRERGNRDRREHPPLTLALFLAPQSRAIHGPSPHPDGEREKSKRPGSFPPGLAFVPRRAISPSWPWSAADPAARSPDRSPRA